MWRLFFLFWLPIQAANADIFKCNGTDGRVIYQKSPCQKAERVEINQPPHDVLARMRQQEQMLDLREHQRRVRDAEIKVIKAKERAWDQWRYNLIQSRIDAEQRQADLEQRQAESDARWDCLLRRRRSVNARCY